MAIESLFGASVADIEELRRQQAEKQIAGAGQEFGVFAPLYQAGLRFGNQAVRGVNTLMGVEDPMLKKATDIQSVLSKYQDQDLSDPLILNQIANNLAGLGYAKEAFSLAQTAKAGMREQERAAIERQRVGFEGQRVGFEQQRVGLEQQRIGLEQQRIRDAQYRDNPELLIEEARSLPEDDPRRTSLTNRYYDIKREQQSKIARDNAELARINAQTEESRARAAREGELGVVGKPGSIGKGGAYRDINGQVWGPSEMKKVREEYDTLDKMLYKINQITNSDVRAAESWLDLTGAGTIPKELAGKVSPKTVEAQTKIAASQLLEQINNLPPGAASDADMKASRASFPGYGSEVALRNWINNTKQTINRYHASLADRFGFERKITATAPLTGGGTQPKAQGGETGSWSIISVQPFQSRD